MWYKLEVYNSRSKRIQEYIRSAQLVYAQKGYATEDIWSPGTLRPQKKPTIFYMDFYFPISLSSRPNVW